MRAAMSINFRAILFSTLFLVSTPTWSMWLGHSLSLPPQEKHLEAAMPKPLDILLRTIKTALSNLQLEDYKEKLLAEQGLLKDHYATFQFPATLKQISFIAFLLDGSVARMLDILE